MTNVLIIGFLAGALAANGVPHFVKGITGRHHMTPFRQPSNALANVIWGWLNFVAAGSLWSLLAPKQYATAFTAAALGSLIVAALLATYWSRHSEKNRPK